jgi:hypothetical protein
MPVQQVFDPEDHVVRTTITGTITAHDLDLHLERLHRTGGGLCPELIDLRRAGPGGISHHELVMFAQRARLLVGRRAFSRYAVVVGTDAQFSLARKVACYVADWLRVGVFDDEETARAWLLGDEADVLSRAAHMKRA